MSLRPLVLAALAACAPAAAGAATLTSGPSEVTVADDGTVTVWRVEEGGSDNVFLSAYYLRLAGDDGEATFPTIFGVPVVEQPSPDVLGLSFAGDPIEARLDYRLTDGPELGRTTLERSATLTNTGTEIVEFVLFDYTDLDIRFDPLNQRDQATLVAPGVVETVSASVPVTIVSEVTPTPDQYLISDFLTLALAFLIESDGVTTLPNTPALGEAFPETPGDNAFAFGWEVSLAPGESFTAAQSSTLATAVPVPASLVLMLGGIGALALVRRR